MSITLKKRRIIWTKDIWILSYLKKKLKSLLKPIFKIFHVEGEGLCPLRSFLMGMRSTFEIDVTADKIISTLQKKL